MNNFEQTNGMITFKRKIIAYQQNPKLLLILTNARQGFSAEDHDTFDKMVYATIDGVERRYIDSFSNFFDPKSRYEAFLNGDNLDGFGLNFTAEELALAQTIASVKAKINAAFKMPELPYVNAAAIDVKKIYGSQADRAQLWLAADPSVGISDWQLQRIASNDPAKNNLLRHRTMPSGAIRVENLTGHHMTEAVAKRLWRKLKPLWAKETYNDGYSGDQYAHGGYHGDRRIKVYRTYVKIGCQTVPRAEVERIARELNFDAA